MPAPGTGVHLRPAWNDAVSMPPLTWQGFRRGLFPTNISRLRRGRCAPQVSVAAAGAPASRHGSLGGGELPTGRKSARHSECLVRGTMRGCGSLALPKKRMVGRELALTPALSPEGEGDMVAASWPEEGTGLARRSWDVSRSKMQPGTLHESAGASTRHSPPSGHKVVQTSRVGDRRSGSWNAPGASEL